MMIPLRRIVSGSVAGKSLAMHIGSRDTTAVASCLKCIGKGSASHPAVGQNSALSGSPVAGKSLKWIEQESAPHLKYYSALRHYTAVGESPVAGKTRPMEIRSCCDTTVDSPLKAEEESAHRLRGYFFHPVTIHKTVRRYSAFRPVHRYSLRYFSVQEGRELCLDKYVPKEAFGYHAVDCHLGLVILQRPADKGLPDCIVWDPASGHYVCLPPPPAEALKTAVIVLNDNSPDNVPENIGAVILSRQEEGDTLRFEVAYVTMEEEGEGEGEGHSYVKAIPWIATCEGHNCTWKKAPFSISLKTEGPFLYIDKYSVRLNLNRKIAWHFHGVGMDNMKVMLLDSACKSFSLVSVPRPEYRLGEDTDGSLIAGLVGPYNEHLYLSKQIDAKGYSMWCPMTVPYGLPETFAAVPVLSTRVRRVTRLIDFDHGYDRSVIIKASGNAKFRYHFETARLERLITSDGMEWGHPVFPYFEFA